VSYDDVVSGVVDVVEGVGAAIMVLGALAGFVRFAIARRRTENAYEQLRQNVGRAILLGLEVLIIADIIRTHDRGRAHIRERHGPWGHRRDPDRPELLPRGRDRRRLAVASCGRRVRGCSNNRCALDGAGSSPAGASVGSSFARRRRVLSVLTSPPGGCPASFAS
jgi:Protein of unknown function (DUF1622)